MRESHQFNESIVAMRGGNKPEPENPRFVVILVHGTFAKANTWTKEGALLAALEALPSTVVQSCDWPGTNTLAGGHEGASRVCSMIVDALSRDERVQIVIAAHSHGGSLSLRALGQLRPEHAQRVRGVACLSTPFLRAFEASDRLELENIDDLILNPLLWLLLTLVVLLPVGFFLEWLKARVPSDIAHFALWLVLSSLIATVGFLLGPRLTSALGSAHERLFMAINRAVATAGRAVGPVWIAIAIAIAVVSLLAAGAAIGVETKRLAETGLAWPETSDPHTRLSLSYQLLRPVWVGYLRPLVTENGSLVRSAAMWTGVVAASLTPITLAAMSLMFLTTLLRPAMTYIGSEFAHMRRLVEVEGPHSAKLLLASVDNDEVQFLLKAVNGISRLASRLADSLFAVVSITLPISKAVQSGWGITSFSVVFLVLALADDLMLTTGRFLTLLALACIFSWPVLAYMPTVLFVCQLPLLFALSSINSLLLTPFAADLFVVRSVGALPRRDFTSRRCLEDTRRH